VVQQQPNPYIPSAVTLDLNNLFFLIVSIYTSADTSPAVTLDFKLPALVEPFWLAGDKGANNESTEAIAQSCIVRECEIGYIMILVLFCSSTVWPSSLALSHLRDDRRVYWPEDRVLGSVPF